jgi:hypothetical protein
MKPIEDSTSKRVRWFLAGRAWAMKECQRAFTGFADRDASPPWREEMTPECAERVIERIIREES